MYSITPTHTQELPKDYRHGLQWHDYDPTKWVIWLWEQMGLAWGLHRTDWHLVRQSMLRTKMEDSQNQAAKAQAELARHMKTGGPQYRVPPMDELPVWTPAEFRQRATKSTYGAATLDDEDEGKRRQPRVVHSRYLLVVGDVVFDIKPILRPGVHPGGAKLLMAYVGKDASEAFHGGFNTHSQSAQNMMQRFRVAKLSEPLAD
jgi:stearoyl-CoA desaturase (delta-9 desaturase)